MLIDFENISKMLVKHSITVQPNDRVLIRVPVNAIELGQYLFKAVLEKEGFPVIEYVDEQVGTLLLENYSANNMQKEVDNKLAYYKTFDCVITFRSKQNDYELANIDPIIMQNYMAKNAVISNQIVNNTRWVLLDYPSDLMASKNKMSKAQYINFYNSVCLIDYPTLEKALQPLKDIMDKTKKVRITGPGTDIEFSIDGIGSIICAGKRNVPDGEVYTSPVRDSVNGKITYNTPATYGGDVFENICFEFENGKIVKATCSGDEQKLNSILDTDEGARYIGEFAIGVNPAISHPIGNILFDEKIHGSFHFTPGKAYENEADNKNRSAIHWDIISIQRPEYGGGEIYFDDVLIRKDGKFMIESLKGIDNL